MSNSFVEALALVATGLVVLWLAFLATTAMAIVAISMWKLLQLVLGG